MRSEKIFKRAETFSAVDNAKQLGLYPYFRQNISQQCSEVVLKGNKRVLMLGSNSYLGLTSHPEVKAAAIKAIEKYGSGCSGSRLLNGTMDIHQKLETEIADWVGKEAALLYPTGFQVNQGVISALLTRKDHVVLDFQNHASIVDGARISTARIHRYAHNDIQKLEKILSSLPEKNGRLIVSDGVFSMEGDIVRLPELVDLAERYGAVVMIDDAHGIGVLGSGGSGTCAHFGLTRKVDLIMGTLSKSLASIGGFIAADGQTIEFLKHTSRAFIFSASMAPASAAAALTALRIIRREPQLIERLWRNTNLMRKGLKGAGFDTGLSETPIIPVHIGDELKLLKMCKRLEDMGVYINPVLPPAVPARQALLRVSLMATHTREQVVFALEAMVKVGTELGII